jgi:NhaA family Na+:H+ antiporter
VILSLAIADDIGAVLVIAIGYTETIHLPVLLLGLLGMGIVITFERLGVRSLPVYVVIGAVVWFEFHESGVHATVAGVLLGLMTPARSYVSEGQFTEFLNRAGDIFRGGGWKAEPDRAGKIRRFRRAARETIPLIEYLEYTLHPWVGFVIMPIFALANAGVVFELSDFGDPIATAVMAGLVIGKPVGIVFFSFLAIRVGLAGLPEGVSWRALTGGGILAGIGFTMALFIADLALGGDELSAAKVGILGASAICAIVGMALLSSLPRESASDSEAPS